MEAKDYYFDYELPLEKALKIQEALKPLGYVVEGYHKEHPTLDIILRLSCAPTINS